MLETYEQEVIRKRRTKRIFWILVFGCAGFLFFFFQGYYPSIDFSIKEIFQSGGIRRPERDEFVKSFGIINITVTPNDAKILLSGEQFSNDEKRMVKYGNYLLSVGKPGYIQNWTSFQIHREKPFFIDKIHLIPKAKYERIGTGTIRITKLPENGWILERDNVMLYLEKDLSDSIRIDKGGYPIGEGYFLSGETLLEYKSTGWEKKTWIGSPKVIRECDESLQIKLKFLWCPKTKKALSVEGKAFTGIIAIGDGYLRTHESIITDNYSINLSPSESRSEFFLEKDGIWYVPERGNFLPLVDQKHTSPLPLIITVFDEISFTHWLEGELLIFGRKGGNTLLGFLRGENEIAYIPFPNIPLEEVRIIKNNGNIFFKMKSALLFLYNNTENIEWLINGNILTFSPEEALYEKDGTIWRANWKDNSR